MNEHQNIQNAENEQPKDGKNLPKEITPEEMAKMCRKGKLKLAMPILASGKEVDELEYDFGKLTGWDFANAVDGATSAKSSAFRLTQRQALMLFAAAAEKCNDGVDAEDIKRRMSIDDAIKATQIAALFFNTSSQVGNMRMSN